MKLNDSEQDTMRKCIVCTQAFPKSELIRFVVGPDQGIYVDVLNKLPGRGLYVHASLECLSQVSAKHFSRAAKQPVQCSENVFSQVDAALARRAVDLIALARKSGAAVCGFEKVKGWLAGSEVVRVLLQASDGSARGKDKLWTPTGAKYFGCLTSQELGLAFGRQNVIHCALSTGGLSNRVVDEMKRLMGLRGIDGAMTPLGKEEKSDE